VKFHIYKLGGKPLFLGGNYHYQEETTGKNIFYKGKGIGKDFGKRIGGREGRDLLRAG